MNSLDLIPAKTRKSIEGYFADNRYDRSASYFEACRVVARQITWERFMRRIAQYEASLEV